MSGAEESSESDTSSDASSIIYQMATVAAVVGAQATMSSNPAPGQLPPLLPPLLFPIMTGRQWVELNLRDASRSYNNFRMSPNEFLQLHDILVNHHGLESSEGVSSVEALAMFVWACATKQSCRQIHERFERSLSTVSNKMGMVADVMYSFAQTVICPKDPSYSKVHHSLQRYAPYFDGCIGALDGTHVKIRINHDSRLDYLNRKGCTSYNILAIVDMDMRFIFVGAGRAGSSHDMSVLTECLGQPNYPHPPPGMLAC